MKSMVSQHPDKEGREDLMAGASQDSCTLQQVCRGEEGSREVISESVGAQSGVDMSLT